MTEAAIQLAANNNASDANESMNGLNSAFRD
jgi:hypothetical protein